MVIEKAKNQGTVVGGQGTVRRKQEIRIPVS